MATNNDDNDDTDDDGDDDGNDDDDDDDEDLCAADRGAGEASVWAGVKDAEALVEDADGVVHVRRVVRRVVALASGKASLKIWVGMWES